MTAWVLLLLLLQGLLRRTAADRRTRAERAAADGRVRRVGALVRRSLEEVVLQGIVRCAARLRIVVQHPQYQILELQVVGHAVAGFAVPPAARAARFHAEDVVQLARAGRLVLALVLRLPQHVAAVGELLEELASFVRLVEDVLRGHPEHLDDLVDLVGLVRAGEERLAGVHLDQDAPEGPHVYC